MPDSDAFAGHGRASDDLKPIELFAWIFYCALSIFIVLFGISQAMKPSAEGHWLTAIQKGFLGIGVSFIVTLAAASVGCLLGFLFGIPRSLQRLQATPPSGKSDTPSETSKAGASTRSFATNTSFEEISDWLTKIIIGLGLVQFNTFLTYLYRASLYASSFVADKAITEDIDKITTYDPGMASPYFFSLIITALVTTCLFSYLETRTRLTLIFVGAEKNLDQRATEELVRAADRSVTEDLLKPTKTSPTPPSPEDDKIVQIPREALHGTKEILGWASAQARKGNFLVAEDALRDALQRDPENKDLRLRLADVRRLRGDYTGALEVTKEALKQTSDPKEKINLLMQSLYAALYLPSPESFQTALPLSEQLLNLPIGRESAAVHLWRAAALGQKYLWLKQNAGDAQELAATREQALNAIKEVVRLQPDPRAIERVLLRNLLNPTKEGAAASENDLEVFKDDPEFQDLVYGGAPKE